LKQTHLTLQEFDGGVEINMSGFNSGDSVREFLTALNPVTPVACLGDDQADEDAFRVLQDHGLRIPVRRGWRERRPMCGCGTASRGMK
jgi:trehalose-6-phosphatase